MSYYVFKDEDLTIVLEAKEVIDDYGQIEVIDMKRNLAYNRQLDKLFYSREFEEFLVIEKANESDSKLSKIRDWNTALKAWNTALKAWKNAMMIIHNIDEKDILKRFLQ